MANLDLSQRFSLNPDSCEFFLGKFNLSQKDGQQLQISFSLISQHHLIDLPHCIKRTSHCTN